MYYNIFINPKRSSLNEHDSAKRQNRNNNKNDADADDDEVERKKRESILELSERRHRSDEAESS